MSQEIIYDLLKKNKKPMSRKEICNATALRDEVVSKKINKMIKYGEVGYVELDRIKVKSYCSKNGLPRVKQRMRLYFVNE